MPQINIPSTHDAVFLAEMAGLDKAWAVTPVSSTEQSFSFLADKFAAVEAALLDYPEAYLTYRKGLKLEEIANKRRAKEVQGPMGLTLDDKTVARLTAAAVGLMIDTSRTSVRWEMTRGVFQEIPRNNVLGLAVAAVNHVQGCFDAVYDKTQAVQAIQIIEDDLAGALAELNAVDLESGWPS